MKKRNLALTTFFMSTLSSIGSASTLQECQQTWQKLLPYVNRPMYNDLTYLQMAKSDNSAKALEKRVSIEVEDHKLKFPDWDFGWIADVQERSFLVKQESDLRKRVRYAKLGYHRSENVQYISHLLLTSESKNVKTLAMYALADIGDPEGAAALMQFNDTLQSTALASLDYKKAPQVLEEVSAFLLRATSNHDVSLQGLALAQMKSPKVLPFLKKNMLTNSDSWNSLRGYMSYKTPEAVPVFLEVAKAPKGEGQMGHAIMGLTYFSKIGMLDSDAQQDAFILSANSYLDKYNGLNGEPLCNLVNLAPANCKK